jgi:hypothetical protein
LTFAVVHGLYSLAANLAASGRLLIAIDEVQWSDCPSIRWLAYLGSRLEGLGVGVVTGLRPTERTSLGSGLARLAGQRHDRARGLVSRHAVAVVVRESLGATADD